MRFWMLVAALALLGISGNSATAQVQLPGGIRIPRDTVQVPPGSISPPPIERLPFITNFSVVSSAQGERGFLPKDDQCLPVPRLAGQTWDNWGLSFSVRAGSKPLQRVRICRVDRTERRCFLDQQVSTNTVSTAFVPVPDEPEPDPSAPVLPRIRYEIEVVVADGTTFRSGFERKIAPLPKVAIEGPASAWRNQYRTSQQLTINPTVRYANTQNLGVLAVRGGDNPVLETHELADESPPERQTIVVPSREHSTKTICDARTISESGFDLWRGAHSPVRIWAAAPLIDGCRLTAVSAPVSAQFFPGSGSFCTSASTSPRPPPVTMTSPGGSGGSSASCIPDAPCRYKPPECNNPPEAVFEVAGKTRCLASGRSVCEPAERYCSTCGGDCGDCHQDPCQEGTCAPGTVCGNTGFGNRCQPLNRIDRQICTPSTALCWMPRVPGQMWDRPTDAEYCGGPTACVPQCLGSQCGNDGCGGSCGTCSAGQTCQANPASPYGGSCVTAVPFHCTGDNQCPAGQRCRLGRCSSFED